jgi:chemotaxis protein histidine kinase CheA
MLMHEIPASESTPNEPQQIDSLEAALAETEAATERALDAAAQLTRSLRRLRGAAQVGNLRDVRATLSSVEQAAEQAEQQARQAAASWQLDEDAYFGDGRFTEELMSAAQRDGLQLFERDECPPNDRSSSTGLASGEFARPS